MASDVRGIPTSPSEITIDPLQMQAILARALLPAAGSAYDIADCRVVSSRHRDRTRATVIVSRRNRDESLGTILYQISLVDRETGAASECLVTGLTLGGMRTRRIWDSARASVPAEGKQIAGPFRPYAYVPELDMLLQVFPHDIRLPAIARLIPGPDDEIATLLLPDLGPGDWQVTAWAAEAVQYRPDLRAIIRLDVQFTDARSTRQVHNQYFAKVYRENEPARQSFRVQSEIYGAVQRAGIGMAVAKPIAFIDDVNTTITSAVPGMSLAAMIREGGDLESVVRSAARAMAAFHHLQAPAPVRSTDEDINQLRDAQTLLTSRRPDLNDQVAEIIASVHASLSSAPSKLIHGDLKPEHFLIDGNSVAIIDLDFSTMADPVTDVAYLITLLGKTEERSRRWGKAAGLARQVFLEEYFSHVPESWRTRLGVYHAMMSVHKAASLSQQSGSEGEDLVASVISEGQALLTTTDATFRSPTFKRRPNRTSAQKRNVSPSPDS